MTKQEALNKIADLQKYIESLDKKPWVPEMREDYWSIDAGGYILKYVWSNDWIDNYKLRRRNVFKTQDDVMKYQDIETKLLSGNVDWSVNGVVAYYPCYGPGEEVFVSPSYGIYGEGYYFSSESEAQAIIDELGDGLKWFFRHKMGLV